MAKLIDGTLYLTVSRTAEALATTEMQVLTLMREQVLVGLEQDGEWLVEADSVAACLTKGVAPEGAFNCANCTSIKGCN